jgi:hypothetical protein
MWWNPKKKLGDEVSGSRLAGRASAGINKYVIERQTKLARFLNQKTETLSTGGKKLVLVAVCLVFGGLSLYVIVSTLGRPSKIDESIKPKAISVPEHASRTGEESLYPHIVVSAQEMWQVSSFKRYMDSLKSSLDGRPLYDSILKARPNLLDTIAMLEELYLLQQK